MSTRKTRKQIDYYQCQICGDYHGKIYPSKVTVQVQAHHIIPLVEKGPTEINNLITLCDLCHAVVTPQRWKEYFGEAGTTQNMEPIMLKFNEYLISDTEKREKIKKRIWGQFQIEPRNKNHKKNVGRHR
jgi:hypothetical protein